MSKVILLAGGGGHSAYAYALAQHLHGRCELESIVPEGDNLSYDRLSKFGKVSRLIKPRHPKTPHHHFLVNLIKSSISSSHMIGRRSVVVSTGSNFCIPPSMISLLNGSKVVNIESSIRFTRASKTAKILSHFAAITALQFPEQKDLIRSGNVYGPLLAQRECQPRNDGYILVTGGTYGHPALFEKLDAMASLLDNVILQAGPYFHRYSSKHKNWKVIDYSSKFHELIAGAEIVITHFGETAIDSALVYGKPTIIAVNPEWTRTVGMNDARILSNKLNAVLLEEITEQSVFDAIRSVRSKVPTIYKNGAIQLAEDIITISK